MTHLAIDARDCIGCDVCVAHCDRGVLRMLEGKAVIDLRNLQDCDADGRCVEVCPTHVISLRPGPADGAAAAQAAFAAGAGGTQIPVGAPLHAGGRPRGVVLSVLRP